MVSCRLVSGSVLIDLDKYLLFIHIKYASSSNFLVFYHRYFKNVDNIKTLLNKYLLKFQPNILCIDKVKMSLDKIPVAEE